jgi:hypothetical protein
MVDPKDRVGPVLETGCVYRIHKSRYPFSLYLNLMLEMDPAFESWFLTDNQDDGHWPK